MKELIIRSLSGLVFVAIIIVATLWRPLSFTIVFSLLAGYATWEYCHLLNKAKKACINKYVCVLASMLLFWVASVHYVRPFASLEALLLPYICLLMYAMVSELWKTRPSTKSCTTTPTENWAYVFASQFYIALPFALLNLLAYRIELFPRHQPHLSWIYPLGVFAFLWANDTGAYLFGSMLRKYIPFKLSPHVSPNKSWIGSVGGLAVAIIAALLIASYKTFLSTWEWVGLAAVVCVFGTFGDLIESLIKREMNLKDSGKFLPGHGGVLDRFDSALLAIPAAVVYLYIVTYFR